jgi:GTP-binding protein|tara:strand:+ start:19810 stop:21291 length:1482 start_codon:yes stop_codon:yes gene_type:complete
MISTFALVGRPNVGKSTLFNRLTQTRDALVADFPGLTRDRKYGKASHEGVDYAVIDTGGISGEEEGIDIEMAGQALLAIDEADEILFMVDARTGLTPPDQHIANLLRRKNLKVQLVVNKIDGVQEEIGTSDFHGWGFGEPIAISSSQGRGINQLLDSLLDITEEKPEEVDEFVWVDDEDTSDKFTAEKKEEIDRKREQEYADAPIRIAVVGRPNVGKSTLVNRMLGEERVIVFDMPGTTRDSIYIDYERDEQKYTLIDTAGVRRRKNIKEVVEKFSIIKALNAIDDAQVVILLIDGQEGLVDQDLHLLGYAIESGRALVVAVNKWDGLEPDERELIKAQLDRRLRFIDYADIHYISALHGSGVGKLYGSIERAYQSATESLSTNRLTRILEDALSDHPPPLVRGRRMKMRYAHAGGKNPPSIIIHGNSISDVPNHYVRYLQKTFRQALGLHGTPLKIEFRSGENPFAGRKNKLTARQISKKKRLMKHVKKGRK